MIESMTDDATRRYRNTSKVAQTIVGVGTVEPGHVVEVTGALDNANFDEVVEKKSTKKKD